LAGHEPTAAWQREARHIGRANVTEILAFGPEPQALPYAYPERDAGQRARVHGHAARRIHVVEAEVFDVGGQIDAAGAPARLRERVALGALGQRAAAPRGHVALVERALPRDPAHQRCAARHFEPAAQLLAANARAREIERPDAARGAAHVA